MKFPLDNPKCFTCCALIVILMICWLFQPKYMEIIYVIIAVLIYLIVRNTKYEHFDSCNLGAPDYYGTILDPASDAIRFSYGQTYDQETIRQLNDEQIHKLAEENVKDMLENVDMDTLYYSQYGSGYGVDWNPLTNPDSPWTQILAPGMDPDKFAELIKEKAETEGSEAAQALAFKSILAKEKVRLMEIRRLARENQKSKRLLEAESHNPDIILPLDTWFKADQGASDIFGKKSCECPGELHTNKIKYSAYSENPEDVWENEFDDMLPESEKLKPEDLEPTDREIAARTYYQRNQVIKDGKERLG